MKSSWYIFKTLTILTEASVIHLALQSAYYFRFSRYIELGSSDVNYFLFFSVFTLVWIVASLLNDSYESDQIYHFSRFARSFATTLFIHLFIVMIYIATVKEYSKELSRWFMLYSYIMTAGGVALFRGLLFMGYRYFDHANYNLHRVAIIGSDSVVQDLYQFFNSKKTQVFQMFDQLKPGQTLEDSRQELQENIEDLKNFCLREEITEIYLSMSMANQELIEDLSDFADNNFIHFRMVNTIPALGRLPVNLQFLGHIQVLSLRNEPLKLLVNRIAKRAFDIFFSGMVIAIIFPVLLPIVALLIKLESKGPVFFKQLRTGINGEDFLCFKFRTMTVNGDSDHKQATKGDKRITKIGAFLRKTSLDEFPQFLNVFLGDMSVVGPRPHMLKHTEEYSQSIDKYLYRHFIYPGITGHAQVNGYRGETRDPSLMKKRIEFDNWYIENWSLFLDLKIIFMTVINALRGEENAY
jgi:putative colanic acid biosynthesis UDP-glucose lipid carrier transferase